MKKEIFFSKKSDDWSTPKSLYYKLDKEFNFNFDPCPLKKEIKNAFFIDWGKRVFINPPFSNISNFLDKGLMEMRKGNTELLVYLLPVRSDTIWFHKYIWEYEYPKPEIRFLKGRLKFGNEKNSAPFPSMIVIYRKK